METLRLRSLQKPSHVDGLLGALVKRLGTVPDYAQQITDHSELPSALQKIIHSATRAGQSWRGWGDPAFHFWLFVAEMSLPLSRERGSPVLQVKQYRENGLKDTGNWLIDRKGDWQRCVD